ncbi:acyltransferase [Acinetobacter sp. ANC 3781]
MFTKFLPDIPLFMKFRGFLYSLMMKKCGKNFQVCSTVYINSLTGLEVGENVYMAHNSVLLGKEINIDDEVLIGPNSVIVSGNHTYLNGSFRFGPSSSKPIFIQKGVWIGANCTILAGSIIPCCSIIGAGSVVSKKFEQNSSLYAGNPAKLIKKLNI